MKFYQGLNYPPPLSDREYLSSLLPLSDAFNFLRSGQGVSNPVLINGAVHVLASCRGPIDQFTHQREIPGGRIIHSLGPVPFEEIKEAWGVPTLICDPNVTRQGLNVIPLLNNDGLSTVRLFGPNRINAQEAGLNPGVVKLGEVIDAWRLFNFLNRQDFHISGELSASISMSVLKIFITGRN